MKKTAAWIADSYIALILEYELKNSYLKTEGLHALLPENEALLTFLRSKLDETLQGEQK